MKSTQKLEQTIREQPQGVMGYLIPEDLQRRIVDEQDILEWRVVEGGILIVFEGEEPIFIPRIRIIQ